MFGVGVEVLLLLGGLDGRDLLGHEVGLGVVHELIQGLLVELVLVHYSLRVDFLHLLEAHFEHLLHELQILGRHVGRHPAHHLVAARIYLRYLRVRGKVEARLVLGCHVVGQMREVCAFVSEGQRVVALLLLFVHLLLRRLDDRLCDWLPLASFVPDEIIEVPLVLLPQVVHLPLVLFVYDLASLELGCDLSRLLLDQLGVKLAEVPGYRVDLWRFLVGVSPSHTLRFLKRPLDFCLWGRVVSGQKIVVLHLHFLLLPFPLLLYFLLLLLLQLQSAQIFPVGLFLPLLLQLVSPHKWVVVWVVTLIDFGRGCFFERVDTVGAHLLVSLVLFGD